MSGSATHGTEGARRHPFTAEDETLSLSVVGKQAETAQMRTEGMERQGNGLSEIGRRDSYSFITPVTSTKPIREPIIVSNDRTTTREEGEGGNERNVSMHRFYRSCPLNLDGKLYGHMIQKRWRRNHLSRNLSLAGRELSLKPGGLSLLSSLVRRAVNYSSQTIPLAMFLPMLILAFHRAIHSGRKRLIPLVACS